MKLIRPAVVLFALLTALTGLIYPAVVTGIAQVVFPKQANGSLIIQQDKVLGSSLIGQQFSSNQYFWSRPSATGPMSYNAAASGGANLGPTNSALTEAITARVETLKTAHPEQKGLIPVDLVTTSASGLDPEISPAAALYQLERIAASRNLSSDKVKALIEANTQAKQWGIFGEERVNVLQLNLALDQINH